MRKYLAILIFFVFSIFCKAQEIRFGIFVDPQMSWLIPDSRDVESDGSKFGFNVGLLVDKNFAENYAISTGLSINSVGGSLKYANSISLETQNGTETLNPNASVSYKLQYVTVPLGLKFKTNAIGYKVFYAHLGVNAHVNIKATGSATSSNVENENISKEINILNLSYHIGGGLEYSLGGNTAVNLGIVYINGFTDVVKDEGNKAILRNLAIRVGILF